MFLNKRKVIFLISILSLVFFLTINDIKSCKGDAGVTIRKGKKIVSYDYALDLGWTLKLMDIGNKEKVISTCTGRYEIPEVTDQEEVKDWEIRVSV